MALIFPLLKLRSSRGNPDLPLHPLRLLASLALLIPAGIQVDTFYARPVGSTLHGLPISPGEFIKISLTPCCPWSCLVLSFFVLPPFND
jgi:hypothetical protein